MPAQFTYTNPVTLRKIARELIIGPIEGQWIFTEVFPIENIEATVMRWIIEDNMFGLMAMRGVGGEPTRIKNVGSTGYEATPAYFGEFGTLDENEILRRAMLVAGVPGEVPISVNDLIQNYFDTMKVHYYNRLKQMAGDLLNTGTLTITLPDGAPLTLGQYTQVTDSPAVPYTTLGTAAPMKEGQLFQARYGRGTSAKFNNTATRWMNGRTFTLIQLNTNANDIYGKKNVGGDSLVSLEEFNRVFVAAGAPQIGIVDDFYLDNAGETVMDIPDGVEYVIGSRPQNEKPGAFMLTANANNPNNASGVYAFVDDRTKGPNKTVPPRIDVHMGFNGNAVIKRPKQIIKRVLATPEDMDTVLGAIE